MRRLTLILSDLFLPAEAVKESFPAMLDLPGLEWLLRFASVEHIGDWRHWLARELGATGVAELPVAHACALAAKLPAGGAWMATPVALEARLDHVRLRDRGLLRLPLEQQQALRAEFSQTFGGVLELRAGGERAFLLRGGPGADIHTQDPARLLDSDIGGGLPSGSAAAGELRRLGAEIEMWLYGSPVNAARERAGQRRISALWLWGGGTAAPDLGGRADQVREFRLHGGDNYVMALCNLLGGEPRRQIPAAFGELGGGAPAFVELSPMSGSQAESLVELERNWFAPARAALTAGKLDSLSVLANDRVFDVGARAGWRVWRRRTSWLESLGRAAQTTKA
jgi:hypothetical protein